MTWTPVAQPTPVKLHTTCAHDKAKKPRGFKRCVVLPDAQFGWRILNNGMLDPFHDEKALDLALAIVHDVQPDQVVLLGDYLDLPEMSLKYSISPEMARTTQASINALYDFLVDLRATAPKNAEIAYLEGNHDKRLQLMVNDNAKAAVGLKRANSLPEDWPVLSVPYLLRLDDLSISYVDGYPAARHMISPQLQAIHGVKFRSNGSSAAAVINDLDGISSVFGHIHRREYSARTVHTSTGPRTMVAASPGCLCRIDGAVPGTKSAQRLSGSPVIAHQNWQQGVGIVTYSDSYFSYENVAIEHVGTRRQAIYKDKVYRT